MPDEGTLPDGLDHVRTTPVFDETSVPDALCHTHRVATGVWGRLVVHHGGLVFVFEGEGEGEADEGRAVVAGGSVVIPPERPHHLVVDDPVSFAIEFHRRPDSR